MKSPMPRPETSPLPKVSIPLSAKTCRIMPATMIAMTKAIRYGTGFELLAGFPSAPTSTPEASIHGLDKVMYHAAPKA